MADSERHAVRTFGLGIRRGLEMKMSLIVTRYVAYIIPGLHSGHF